MSNLLVRYRAIGCDQDRGDRCELLIEMEAVIEFDAVHTRQPVVQHKEARREVPHQLQCGMAVACHDGPIGRLLRNRLNEECANVRIVLDEEDRVGCRLRFSRYLFCI